MKIEICIETDGEEKEDMPEKPELEDEQKMAIGKKLQKNIVLTRMERQMLVGYLLEDKD